MPYFTQRQIMIWLLLCLTGLFCFTIFYLSPPPMVGVSPFDDALVVCSDGESKIWSDPKPACAVQSTLVAAVQTAVTHTDGVVLDSQNVACYPTPLTVTAADFCSYRRAEANDITDGAKITYSTLIPLRVTGLRTGAGHGAENYRVLEGVLDLVASFTVAQAADYDEVLFRVILPPGTYDMSYYDAEQKDSQCLHLYRNTWLSMKGVTIRKADTVDGAMLRNCLGSTGASGYSASGNLILEGGTWDVGMDQFRRDSATDRFSTIRLGHGANILLTGVTMNGSINGHHLELCGIQGCSVVNCTFRGYLDTAYHGHSDWKEAIQIDVVNNDAIAPAFGSYDDAVSGNVVVYNNTFRNLCRGVGGHNAVYGLYYANIVVQNNTFVHLTGEAFYGLNYCNALIADNTLRQVGAGVALYALTPSPDDNYFRTCRQTLPPLSMVQYKDAHITVTGNDIWVDPHASLPLGCGITVYGGPYTGSVCAAQYQNATFWMRDVTVSDNRIRYARDAGIYLNCADQVSIVNNRIETVTAGWTLEGDEICSQHSRFYGLT